MTGGAWGVVAYVAAGLLTATVTAYRHRAEVRRMREIHAGRTVVVLGTLLALVAIVWPQVAVCGVIHWLSPKR